MFRSEIEFLKHILDETAFILEYTQNISQQEFLKDEVYKRASARSVEIIGEAVKNLSKEFREQHPSIDWKKITGTRDRLIHGYMEIDYDLLWDIIRNKVPQLDQDIKQIIKNLS